MNNLAKDLAHYYTQYSKTTGHPPTAIYLPPKYYALLRSEVGLDFWTRDPVLPNGQRYFYSPNAKGVKYVEALYLIYYVQFHNSNNPSADCTYLINMIDYEPRKPKVSCECGASAVGSAIHSPWCGLNK